MKWIDNSEFDISLFSTYRSLPSANSNLLRVMDNHVVTDSVGNVTLRNYVKIDGDRGIVSLNGIVSSAPVIPVDFSVSITTNQLHLNLYTWLVAAGWDGLVPVVVTIAAGVYIWSDNTSIPGLNMGGSYPGGLTIINKGYIMGRGGDGGYTAIPSLSPVYPTAGGPAIALTGPVSIDNTNGYIGGGGGGGAGKYMENVAASNYTTEAASGGGGAGGGVGGPPITGSQYSDGSRALYTQGQFGTGGLPGQDGSSYLLDTEVPLRLFAVPGTGAGGHGGIQFRPFVT